MKNNHPSIVYKNKWSSSSLWKAHSNGTFQLNWIDFHSDYEWNCFPTYHKKYEGQISIMTDRIPDNKL